MTKNTTKKKETKLPPLMASAVVAGFPSPADQYTEKDLDLNELMIANPPATFFLRVAGDSMIGAGIHEGDLVVVDKSLNARTGDIVIARVDGDFTVKYFRRRGRRVYLESANPAFPPIDFSQGMELTIWGVVIGVVRKYR